MSTLASPPPERAQSPAWRRRQQRGWYFYDWAASAFTTSVITVFLGPYLTSVAERAAGPDGFVAPLGFPIRAESLFPYTVSLSVVLQVVLLPVVGALADRSGRKRTLLALFAYTGAAATMGLYFLHGTNYLLGVVLFVVANMAFGTSVVVYNAFLPEIAEPDERDGVSARGWALGYLGGGLLLALNLALYLRHDALGLPQGAAVRISLASAGVWWAVFTLVPLRALGGTRRTRNGGDGRGMVTMSVRQVLATLREARRYPQTLLFLGAYLIYNDGVQTVITLASTFGALELKLSQSVLISAVLMVQFVAFAGALAIGALARLAGAKRVVLATLVLWTAVVSVAYFLQPGAVGQFFALAFVIGVVLGGTQALSRSLFSHLIPRGKEAEYFSLYEISERGTAWLGTLVFGLAVQLSGSYRVAIVSLVIFFAVGFVLLVAVNMRRGIRAVGNPQPERV